MPLKLLYFGAIVLLFLYYPFAPQKLDIEVMTSLFSILVIGVFLFVIRKEKEAVLKGQFLKHSTIAIIGILIVHFQYYLDLILGNASKTNYFIWVRQDIPILAMIISLIGIFSFFLGYLMLKSKPIVANPRMMVISTNTLLLLAGGALGLYFATVNPLYLMGNYGSVQVGTTATYADMVFRLAYFSLIIQNCRNMIASGNIPNDFKQYIVRLGWPLNTMLGIYLLAVLLSGDRGPLITFSICYLCGYLFVTKKRIGLKWGIVILIVGASFITILGQVRRMDARISFTERFVSSLNSESENETSISPQTKELASSVKALHHAVEAVPDTYDHLYGRFQIQQILVAVPFFDSFNPLIFEEQHYKYGGSARYVTWLFQGDYPSYGNGTTCIADFYFDFGILGVIVGMFFFGFAMRFGEVSMYKDHYPSLIATVFLFVYISSALYISRSTVLFQFKSMVLIYVVLTANIYLARKTR